MDKFICVGKNYLEHAKELGDAIPEQPVLFLKPPSSGHTVGQNELTTITLPKNRGTVHYECEIILLINSKAQIQAVSLGLDMTLRDSQMSQKKQGLPWEVSKVFADAAIVGPWIPIEKFPNYLDEPFTFSLDGVIRQSAKGNEMRTSPRDCLKFALEMFPILDGDIVFTGTPAGVGPVLSGQIGEIKWGDRLCYRVLFK